MGSKLSKRQKYQKYIKSEKWRSLRSRLIEEAGHRCEVCGKKSKTLQIHHKTYANFGAEIDADLIVLCGGCHMRAHRIQW